jgi:hypothetical protein
MKNILFLAMFMMGGIGPCIMTGCTPQEKQAVANAENAATDAIAQNPTAVQSGIYNGLVALAKVNATDAKLAATAMVAAAQNASASFSGNQLPLGQDAQTILKGLGTKLPASASGIASMITGAIQTFVAIPTGNTAVSASTAQTIVGLCNDLIAAGNQYLASLVPPPTAAPATTGTGN